MARRLVILGCGSSGGVPRIGGDWGACDPSEPRNRRRRCSALIEQSEPGGGTTRVLIDTSPDLREQLLDAGVGELDAVVISHDHADQTHGMDDLRVIAMRMRQRVDVYMDEATERTLMRKFGYAFEGERAYPAVLRQAGRLTPGEALSVNGAGGAVRLTPLAQVHGEIGSLGFRHGPVAYCNDVNVLPEQSLASLTGLKVLIVDALRYTPHPSHAHLDQALEWIEHLAPERAILTNLHVDMDYRSLSRALPPHVTPAHDGLVVTY